jgi:hypothetical protein
MPLTDVQIKYLKSVRRNPLTDYAAQIKSNRKRRNKTIGQTTLSDDTRLSLVGLREDTELGIYDDYGNFNHAKVMASAANRELLLSLMPTTLSLFIWILFNLRYRSDTVEIKYDHAITTGLSVSENTLTNAIKELEAKHVIKRVGTEKRTEEYWLFFINPQILWKGDAKEFYKDVLKYHEEYLPDRTTQIVQGKSRKRKTNSNDK